MKRKLISYLTCLILLNSFTSCKETNQNLSHLNSKSSEGPTRIKVSGKKLTLGDNEFRMRGTNLGFWNFFERDHWDAQKMVAAGANTVRIVFPWFNEGWDTRDKQAPNHIQPKQILKH